jgi:hypothetical protein
MRRKAAEAAEQAGAASSGDTPEVAAPGRASQTWAMLIKRVYEIDPLCCPQCGGTMKVIAFLEPAQGDVIAKILRHCGLWHASRAPPAGEDLVHGPDGHSQAATDAPRELTFVADHAIWGEAAGFREADTFGHDPVDDWYRHLAEDEPRDLTYVDEDTFWSEF